MSYLNHQCYSEVRRLYVSRAASARRLRDVARPAVLWTPQPPLPRQGSPDIGHAKMRGFPRPSYPRIIRAVLAHYPRGIRAVIVVPPRRAAQVVATDGMTSARRMGTTERLGPVTAVPQLWGGSRNMGNRG